MAVQASPWNVKPAHWSWDRHHSRAESRVVLSARCKSLPRVNAPTLHSHLSHGRSKSRCGGLDCSRSSKAVTLASTARRPTIRCRLMAARVGKEGGEKKVPPTPPSLILETAFCVLKPKLRTMLQLQKYSETTILSVLVRVRCLVRCVHLFFRLPRLFFYQACAPLPERNQKWVQALPVHQLPTATTSFSPISDQANMSGFRGHCQGPRSETRSGARWRISCHGIPSAA